MLPKCGGHFLLFQRDVKPASVLLFISKRGNHGEKDMGSFGPYRCCGVRSWCRLDLPSACICKREFALADRACQSNGGQYEQQCSSDRVLDGWGQRSADQHSADQHGQSVYR